MPTFQNIQLCQNEKGLLVVSLSPPVNVAGWDARFDVMKRFGSQAPVYTAWTASGYGGGQSGITILNSGTGQLRVNLPAAALSGQEDNINFAYSLRRYTSGCEVVASQGYLTLMPGGPVNSGA